jgi:hypothetical protein
VLQKINVDAQDMVSTLSSNAHLMPRSLYQDGNSAAAEKTMTPTPTQGETLTTWSVQPGGTRICFGFTDDDETDHRIVLPLEMLSGLSHPDVDGGYKIGGYGRDSGVRHREKYLNVKSVWIRPD